MTNVKLEIRRGVLNFGLLGLGVLLFGAIGCSSSGGGVQTCSRIGGINEFATLELACTQTDLTAVDVSGPCEGQTSTTPELFSGRLEIFVASSGAGVCHVALTFASGFSYAVDVTFTSSTSSSCGTFTVAPTQTVFEVDNPSSTCVDAGSAAGATDQ